MTDKVDIAELRRLLLTDDDGRLHYPALLPDIAAAAMWEGQATLGEVAAVEKLHRALPQLLDAYERVERLEGALHEVEGMAGQADWLKESWASDDMANVLTEIRDRAREALDP